MQKQKIKAKTFKELVGKVLPETVVFSKDEEDKYKLMFAFEDESKITEMVKTTDKRLITKVGQLYGFSYQKLLDDLHNGDSNLLQTQTFLKESMCKDRNSVLLYDKDDLVNMVSEKHKQVSMKKIHEMVKASVKKVPEAKHIGMAETDGGYINRFEVGKTPLMSIRVNIDYGRNDAKGRASIRFTGGGHVFICSNQIIHYVHKELQVHSDVKVARTKLIHTLNVAEQTQKNMFVMFNKAKETAMELNKCLENSKKVKMDRETQIYALKLIKVKHNLGDKWFVLVKEQLEKEKKTLFGLSQALTFIGTRANADYAKKQLCEIGGQVCILGEPFVKLLETNLKSHNVDLKLVREMKVVV